MSREMMAVCELVQPGLMPYAAAYELQKRLIGIVRRDRRRAFLILLEHPPVLTIGRSGTDANVVVPRQRLRDEGIDVIETNRGGDITYHGPGQLVGYPIMALDDERRDVHRPRGRLRRRHRRPRCHH